MRRDRKNTFYLIILAGALGWLALQGARGARADTKNTRPCGDTVCSVNEQCCLTGCPPAYQCLSRRVGKCPAPLPCPPPASAAASGAPDGAEH